MPKVKDLTTTTAPLLTDYTINERVGGSGTQQNKVLWQKIFDLFASNGMGVVTAESGIVAAGTVQGDATPVTETYNRVDTVAAGTGVVEDATDPITRTVQSIGANDLNWYPNGTDQFYVPGAGLLGAGIPFVIAPGNTAKYIRYSAGILTIQF
jgi:hypothetical protein